MTYSCMSLPNPAGRASRQLLWTVVVLHVAARAGGAVAGAPPSFAAVSTGSSRTSGAHTAVCLRLRGGSAIQQQQRYSVRTTTDEVPEDERKPELKRAPSVLVLDEAIGKNTTVNKPATETMFKIDGKYVSETEYQSRVAGVSQRTLEDWITKSDTCGFKEGDMIVPDHCASVPEAIASVAYNGTVFIRNGEYKWDGVLVVQKHLHVRGEPNPDEGTPGGKGRPTLEGRWLLGERSSGSFKHVNCIARFDQNKQEQQEVPGGPEGGLVPPPGEQASAS
ncbi:hypothetical protein T484DRAFT_3497023 [Baffinella frigidus]|nr:hypothetical protein T484DRAFT_3497023 [Cryptophyta sp. CCMP2293]